MKTFLITNKINLLYLTEKKYSNFFVIVHNHKKYLFTDKRYNHATYENPDFTVIVYEKPKETIEEFLKNKKIETIYFNEADISVLKLKNFKKLFKKIKFKAWSKTPKFLKREIKNINEIELIKKSQEINEKIYLKVSKEIQNGTSEIQISKLIKLETLKNNCETSFDPIVAFGENTANIHHSPSEKKYKTGEPVLIDMGVKYKNYCSDMTRVLIPDENYKHFKSYMEDYNTLKQILKKIEENKKTINNFEDINKISKNELNKLNYKLPHSLGHGIGLEVHEEPYFKKEFKIQNNQIFTLEPGIYRENKYGIRLENIYIWQNNKINNLNKLEL